MVNAHRLAHQDVIEAMAKLRSLPVERQGRPNPFAGNIQIEHGGADLVGVAAEFGGAHLLAGGLKILGRAAEHVHTGGVERRDAVFVGRGAFEQVGVLPVVGQHAGRVG